MVQCWESGLLISSMRLSVGFSKDSCFLVGGTGGVETSFVGCQFGGFLCSPKCGEPLPTSL